MASFEFEANLRMQLREAAEREQRRSLVARFAAAARAVLPNVGHSVLPAAAVAATVAAAISVAAIFLMSEPAQRPVAPPEVVAEFKPAASLGATFAAFGSVWMTDTSRDELLRVEPDSRRVVGRLPVAGELALGAGAGALWALQEGSPGGGFGLFGPLLRIDPSTNRVTARIALSTPDGQRFEGYEILTGEDEVWVAGASGALRVDPRTNRVTQAIAAPDQLVTTHFALLDGALWAISEDGRLLRFDTNTGRVLSDARLGLAEASDLSNGPGGALIASTPGELARVEPYTGRVLWRTRVGRPLQAWSPAGGLIWARSSGQVHDRLTALDPDTGAILTRVELEDFGGTAIATVDDELWLSTIGGNMVVLRR
jgi:PQQ-like domain